MILMHNKAIEEVLKELNTSPFCVSEDFFKTVPFGVEHLQYILVMPAVVFFLALELRKWAGWLYNRKTW
jgi:hypothetical protein